MERAPADDWEGELERWLAPFLTTLNRAAQRRWAPSCAAPRATRPWSGSPGRRAGSGSTCGARRPSWWCPRKHLSPHLSDAVALS